MANKKILIVDDEVQLVDMVKMRLEANNYDVIVAYDGQEGLDKARKEKPDLIILDLMLPKMDGYKVCRMLKFDEKYKNIPILMLTALKEKSGLDFKREAGDEVWLPVDDYCDKPLKPAELIVKIEALLKK